MAYAPAYPGGWKNSPDTSTPITAAALQNMESGIGGALPAAGGTMTGPLLVNVTGSAAASPRETVDLASSASAQARMRLESFFETDPTGAAEVLRMHFGRASGSGAAGGSSSKAALAWFDDTISVTQSQVWVQAHNYLHQYDPQSFASSGVNTSTGVVTYARAGIAPPDAWQVQFSSTGTLPGGLSAGTAYYVHVLSGTTFSVYSDAALATQVALTSQGSGTHTMTPVLSYGNNHHQHFSVEVTDSGLSNKSTRFSVPWGFDTTEVGFFASNVTVHDNALRVVGASGTARRITLGNTLSDNLTPDGTQDRWGLTANSMAESGSNAGSDFALNRYSDTGSLLGTPLFVQRSTGNVSIGGSTSPSHVLEVGGSGTSSMAVIRGATTNSASLSLSTAAVDYWSVQMRNDSTNDLHIRNIAQGLDGIYIQNRATMLNLGLLGQPASSNFGSGVGVIFVANGSTAPTASPVGGGFLFVSAGALKWMGSNGTITQIAAA